MLLVLLYSIAVKEFGSKGGRWEQKEGVVGLHFFHNSFRKLYQKEGPAS